MDFGSGRDLQHELASTLWLIEGTAIYMAPEVLSAYPASHSSDTYSVGVLLYHLVTGAYPVEGRSIGDIKNAHRDGLRTPLLERRPDLSPGFVQVIERALGPKGSRYGSPAALCYALDRLDRSRPVWLQWARTAAAIGAVTLFSLLVLGFVNSIYLNTVLGRAGFVDEGVSDWLKWGFKSALAPAVIAAFILMVIALALECGRLLLRIWLPARKVEQAVGGLIHRSSLDDLGVLSSLSLVTSATILFVTWWYFSPLLGTLFGILPDISTVASDQLTLLAPGFANYHVSYRKAFLGTTIACVLLWYPPVRLAVRTRQPIPRRPAIAGVIVLAFSLLLLDFPYRLLTHDIDFTEVSWDGRSCHVLGERGDDRLIFCPSLPVPRSRTVRADALVVRPPLVDESPAPPGSIDAKNTRSLFKFLTPSPERRADKAPNP
jgi:hypothetical protein